MRQPLFLSKENDKEQKENYLVFTVTIVYILTGVTILLEK